MFVFVESAFGKYLISTCITKRSLQYNTLANVLSNYSGLLLQCIE